MGQIPLHWVHCSGQGFAFSSAISAAEFGPMSHSLGWECAAFPVDCFSWLALSPFNGSNMLILVCVTLNITGIDFLYWRFLRQGCTVLPDTAKGKLMEFFGFSKEREVSGVCRTGETGCCRTGLSFLSGSPKRAFLGLEKN